MGPRVLINGTWYYPTASAMPQARIERQLEDIWHRRHEMIRGGGS